MESRVDIITSYLRNVFIIRNQKSVKLMVAKVLHNTILCHESDLAYPPIDIYGAFMNAHVYIK